MTPLIDQLTELGISSGDIEKAQAYQTKFGGRLEQVLLNMGSLSSEALPTIYSKLLGLETLSAEAVQSWDPPENLDSARLDFLVPRGWLPLMVDSSSGWLLATRSPFDLEVNEWLG